MKTQILDFYREVFSTCSEGPLLRVQAKHFAHPVVTPIFLIGQGEPEAIPDYLSVLGLAPPWVSSTPLRPTLRGHFIRFTKPRSQAPSQIMEGVPRALREEHTRLSVANITAMTPDVLIAIEKELLHSRGEVVRWLALDRGHIQGSLTAVVGKRSAMILLGWVTPEYRKRGVMGALINGALERRASLLAWTFNPILYGKGEGQIALTVYQN